MSDFSSLHENPDSAAPFPVNDRGLVPLGWFADVSFNPDKILELYNRGLLLPAESVDEVWLSPENAWNLWEVMLTHHLVKAPVPRFEELPKEDSSSHPDDPDSWVTFAWE